MIAAGTMITRIQDLIDDYSTETKAKILRALNNSYRDIASDHFWQPLMSEVTLSGTILPSDMEKPYYVEDDTDFIYFPISVTDRYQNSRLYNWFENLTVTSPLLTGSDLVVTANSTTVTSAAAGFTAAMVGEYIQIGTNEGIYKIHAFVGATEVTLADGYRGDTATAQYFEVRPSGTQQFQPSDENGDAISSTTIKFWYQRRPLPLHNDYDQIFLPGGCLAVQIMTHQMMMLGTKYDNDALKQSSSFIDAIGKMKPLNPTRGRCVRPRNRYGSQIVFGRQKVSSSMFEQSGRRIL